MKTFTKLNIIALFVIMGLISNAVNVTFKVDMSQQTVAVEGVHIAGSFQDWDPAATIMTDMGDNIYSYTADFAAGDMIEYKFINGVEWGEDESVPGACAQNNNRFLTVPNEDIILDAVCFGSCGPCGDPVTVTFVIDMSEETISADGIHIAGSFQGWNPSSTEMTDIGGNIYSIPVSINSGETIQYKYINGIDWPESELVPEECGVPDGFEAFNRELVVPDDDITLDLVCFSSCQPCTVGIGELTIKQASVSPNPFTDQLTLDFYLQKASNLNLEIYDMLGNKTSVINEPFQQEGLNSININTENFPKGIYIYHLTTGNSGDYKTGKLVKK